MVVVVCGEYGSNEWCGLEWKAIFDLIKQRRDEEVMLCRFDHAEVEGLYTAGFVDLDGKTAAQLTAHILERLALNDHKPKDYYASPIPEVVDLSAAFDTMGVSSDGRPFTGGLDGAGHAYSATLLGTNTAVSDITFTFGPADALNAVSGGGEAILLPPGTTPACRCSPQG